MILLDLAHWREVVGERSAVDVPPACAHGGQEGD
jgi:hypothetical protein